MKRIGVYYRGLGGLLYKKDGSSLNIKGRLGIMFNNVKYRLTWGV